MIRFTQPSELDIERQQVRAPLLSIHMYDLPPTQDYSLSAICKISESRIFVLKTLQAFFENRKEELDKEKDLGFYESLAEKISSIQYKYDIFEDSLKDSISHWILKLAFTNTPNDEYFFYFYEKILFAARLFIEASKGVKDSHSKDEMDDIRNRYFFKTLLNYAEKSEEGLSLAPVYKKIKCVYEETKEPCVPVPFRFAMKAIESYDADLQQGKALITPYTSFIVLQELFEETLNIHKENLLKVSGYMLKTEPRLFDIVNSLKEYKTHLDTSAERFYDRTERFSDVTYESINQIAVKNFPICMLEIHDSLKHSHGLKHWGRLQFGMFLKGIGLDIKDTIRLFTNELRKTAQGEKKVKEYQYYIEHMYGKQGKKTDYTPWGCQKIAAKAVPSGNDVYGCPFKFYSDRILRQTLQKKKNMSDEDIDEILEERKVDFALGCKKMYEKLHPNGFMSKGIGKHPNSYFSSSYKYFNNPKEKKVYHNLSSLKDEPIAKNGNQ